MIIKKQNLIEILEIIIGNVILAAGYGLFLIPANILGGGLAGLSIALKPLINIDTGLFVIVMTWLLFFVGFFMLGKKFCLTTLLSTFIFPLILNFFINYVPKMDLHNEMISSLYGGALVGIGCGLVFKARSSTGGLDIPPVILKKYFNIKINVSVMIIDGMIILIGFFTYGPYPALIGLIAVFMVGVMIEKTMLLGSQSCLQVFIISEKTDLIEKEIIENLNRGITRIKTEGVYHKKERNMLMVLISKKQYPHLLNIVHKYDDKSFISINDVKEVIGLGFSYHD